MASTRQREAARRNVGKAQRAAKQRKTLTKLPRSVRSDLGKQAAAARKRGGRAGRSLEDRSRSQLYETAKRKGIRGRSKMGKWELIEAIRRAS